MDDNYRHAAAEALRFFARISEENGALNAKIIEHSARTGRITKLGNPAEWDAIMRESAADFQAYAQRIDELLPDFQRNLDLLTKGYAGKIESLDPATDAGAQELEGMRRAAHRLTAAANGEKPNVTALRSISSTIRDSNHDPRMTQAAHRLFTATDSLFTAYEDLETFALKVAFSADQK